MAVFIGITVIEGLQAQYVFITRMVSVLTHALLKPYLFGVKQDSNQIK